MKKGPYSTFCEDESQSFSVCCLVRIYDGVEEEIEKCQASCLVCKAEARHRYLLSSFLVKLCFSGTLRARVMKLGTSIYLVEGS